MSKRSVLAIRQQKNYPSPSLKTLAAATTTRKLKCVCLCARTSIQPTTSHETTILGPCKRQNCVRLYFLLASLPFPFCQSKTAPMNPWLLYWLLLCLSVLFYLEAPPFFWRLQNTHLIVALVFEIKGPCECIFCDDVYERSVNLIRHAQSQLEGWGSDVTRFDLVVSLVC